MSKNVSSLAMASTRLDRAHLALEISAIMDDDGISVEELASRAGISRSTVYAILEGNRKFTQKAIGRKIAEGTGRDFEIDGDKIYFKKKEPSNGELHAGLSPDHLRLLKILQDKFPGREDVQERILKKLIEIEEIASQNK